ncbi:MAG: hypothetical protein NC301_00745 [Bacteroides sp.]|nr:hypothetical protein [Bacteroides sp.]MCM1379436.1 hypothetical protein [Bacteroides sp.]MCM1445297.1 hypothetical protein [Prevotella sp.]
MDKLTKLKICDWLLLVVTLAMLASSIQLYGWWLGMGFICLHIALGIIFFLLIGWHLQLHFNWQNWFQRLMQQKSPVTKLLAAVGTLTLLTAIISTILMFITWHHSAIGSWHGYLGFAFLALAIAHIIKRINFYKR